MGRPRQEYDVDDWVRRYVDEGQNLRQIATAAGTWISTVRRELVERGVEIRPKGFRFETHMRRRLGAALDARRDDADPELVREALRGSPLLARALWRYGANGDGLPGFPPDVCRELLEKAA